MLSKKRKDKKEQQLQTNVMHYNTFNESSKGNQDARSSKNQTINNTVQLTSPTFLLHQTCSLQVY